MARKFLAVLAILAPTTARAEEAISFFHPCPADEMRPMAVDEAATTMDPGHLQLEMDIAVHSMSGEGAARETHTAVMPTRIKVGVTSNLEAQLIVSAYERTATMTGVDAGYGSTTGRVKLNLLGNEGGDVQLAVIPYAGNAGAWFGGLGGVVTTALPAELGLTVVPQVTYTDGVASLATTVTLGHAIVGDLAGSVEAVVGQDLVMNPADTLVQANAGVSYLMTPDIQLDLGGRRGISGDVADLEFFARVSARR